MRNVVLFGGAGYIGRHLVKEVAGRGDNPICLDTVDRGCFDFVSVAATINHLFKYRLGERTEGTDFIHLACPRNKPDTWYLEGACRALDDGIELASKLPNGHRLFVSSMSVHDEPASQYGTFKRTAEVAAEMAGFGIIRLGTVLGAEVCYRNDLGLHVIAGRLAKGWDAWVNGNVERNVMTIQSAVEEILKFPEFREIGGLAAYKDIVQGLGVTVQDGSTGFCSSFGSAVAPLVLAQLKCTFAKLINDIRENKVWAC